MLASVGTVILIVLGVIVGVLVIAFIGVLLLASRLSRAIEESMAEDAQDPAKAWLQVAFGFINYRDPGHASGDVACQASLKHDWSIENREGFLKQAEKLATLLPTKPAWHGIRLINMLRIGTGAGYVTAEECWQLALSAGRELQPAYKSWEEVAAAMHAALDAHKGEWVAAARRSLEENTAQLRQSSYRGVKYDTPL